MRLFGMVQELKESSENYNAISRNLSMEDRIKRNRWYDNQNIMHPFTGVQVTEHGI